MLVFRLSKMKTTSYLIGSLMACGKMDAIRMKGNGTLIGRYSPIPVGILGRGNDKTGILTSTGPVLLNTPTKRLKKRMS